MLFNAFILALRAIKRNLLRSFLTVLGIVIGVASVIAMVILGDGTTAHITNSITKLGSNMLIIRPGQIRKGHGGSSDSAEPFEMSDIQALQRQLPGIDAIAPNTTLTINAIYGNNSYSTGVTGSTNQYFSVRDWELERGRYFTQTELHSGVSVCVIGKKIIDELYGDKDPLGSNLRLKNFSCQVVGLLRSKGAASFGINQDDIIVVPLRMMQRRLTGNSDISSIMVSVKEQYGIKQVKAAIEQVLLERRRIKKNEEADFHVQDMKEVIDTVTSTTKMLTLLLGAVAAISLLVGGIGIMNIMLVSVTERTREIGIRLAVGALERDVLLQFLVESVVLSSIGGVLGIVLELGLAYAGTEIFDIPFIFNAGIIAIAFLFSTVIGVVFGFFPARKAAKLDPIDALRHE